MKAVRLMWIGNKKKPQLKDSIIVLKDTISNIKDCKSLYEQKLIGIRQCQTGSDQEHCSDRNQGKTRGELQKQRKKII